MSKKNGFPNDEIPKSNLLRKLKFLYSGNHLLISCAARNAFPGVVKEKINSAKLIRECKIFCVNEKIHTKKEVASVE